MMRTHYTPSANRDSREDTQMQLKQKLKEWRINVPIRLRYRPGDSQLSFHVLALEVLFKYVIPNPSIYSSSSILTVVSYIVLLIYRPPPTPKHRPGQSAPTDDTVWGIASEAAKTITLITETIMNYLSLDYCPLYL